MLSGREYQSFRRVQQRIRGIDPLESTGSEMVVKIVFIVVGADIELFSSLLAVVGDR